MAAFTDPGIRAVLATIGGDDQITVLPHLDPGVVVARPKPFAGTATTQPAELAVEPRRAQLPRRIDDGALGRGGRLHPASSGSLRAALIEGGDLDLRPEEMPSAAETFRMLRNFGERGLLAQFPAILVALAKAMITHIARRLAQPTTADQSNTHLEISSASIDGRYGLM
jgi:hypothetical protein